jgi:hypothetical protein
MAAKPPAKSGSPPTKKPSGKKAKPLSQKEQSERFKETARRLEVDESGGAFERAMKRVLPPKGQPSG